MRLVIEEALVELFLEGAYLLSKRLVVVKKKRVMRPNWDSTSRS